MIRQPIITVLGHVDHGKTTLLDWIRGTTLAQREAGLITQHIGATEIPLDTVRKVCGDLMFTNLKFTIPGLLFVDTPGHEAFANLRKRGGSIADLAILVVDINQGVQPQTKEAIDILKTFKVPFILAANKLDVVTGWKLHNKLFIKNIEKQIPSVKENYEKRFYKLIGDVSELGFTVDLYTNIQDYSKSVAVVPISAKTGEGVAELLALATGLSQRFLSKRLEIDPKKPAKGTILEIKEEKGMGTTADVIIYDGSLTEDDTIIVGGIDRLVETKIRSLLKPLPLAEIRDKKSRFKNVKEVVAATGIKIIAPNLKDAIAGAPFASARNEKQIKTAKEEIAKEISEVLIETQEEGVILKADTLGSLEAASNLFKQKEIPIKRAAIGNINKNDVAAAAANEPLKAFVLGFNVKASSSVQKDAEKSKVIILSEPVIYKLVEKYEKELEKIAKRLEIEQLQGLIWPAKIRILSQYIFRQCNPAVFGVEVIAGKLKPGVKLMTEEGVIVGAVKTLEDQGKKLEELKMNQQAAISVPGLTIGRQVDGDDILYVDQSEASYRLLKGRARKHLKKSDVEILKELAEIKRKERSTWGI